MPVAFVEVLGHELGQKRRRRTVYWLLLPMAADASDWPELDARRSTLQGIGVFPKVSAALDWSCLDADVLLPYFGHEIVLEDKPTRAALVKVLQGTYNSVELSTLGGEWVEHGIFAVPRTGKFANRQPLPLTTCLLEVPTAERAGRHSYLCAAVNRTTGCGCFDDPSRPPYLWQPAR